MGRYKARAQIGMMVVTALAAGGLVGSEAKASLLGSTPVTIAGTVRDLLGPASADVCARQVLSSTTLPGVFGTRTDAAGRYRLEVPPGDYEVTVRNRRVEHPCATQGQNFDKYVHETRNVSTLVNLDDVDFDLTYHLTDSTWPYGSRPGGEQKVGGLISRDAPDVRMFWDDGAGHVYEITDRRTWGDSYPDVYGHPIWSYERTRTVPALADGTYTGTLWVESSLDPLLFVAAPSQQTYVVDSVPPVITATQPGAGAADGGTQNMRLRFNAHSGEPPAGVTETANVTCGWSRVRLVDITDGGHQVVLVGGTRPTEWNTFEASAGTWDCVTDDPYQLQPGHSYEATIIARDIAGNASTHISTFATYDGPPLHSPSPVGAGPAPDRVEVRYGPDTRPFLRFRVYRTDSDAELVMTQDGWFDAETRTAWIETGADDAQDRTWWPVLEPGRYRVVVEGRHQNGAALTPYEWTFEVTAGV